jgi:hypothetical protein
MATLAGGLPEGAAETAAGAGLGGAERVGTKLTGTGTAGTGVLPSRITTIQLPSGKPLALIALHGTLAATTILLVVLAAIGAG